jgi:hypothetical protein
MSKSSAADAFTSAELTKIVNTRNLSLVVIDNSQDFQQQLESFLDNPAQEKELNLIYSKGPKKESHKVFVKFALHDNNFYVIISDSLGAEQTKTARELSFISKALDERNISALIFINQHTRISSDIGCSGAAIKDATFHLSHHHAAKTLEKLKLLEFSQGKNQRVIFYDFPSELMTICQSSDPDKEWSIPSYLKRNTAFLSPKEVSELSSIKFPNKTNDLFLEELRNDLMVTKTAIVSEVSKVSEQNSLHETGR